MASYIFVIFNNQATLKWSFFELFSLLLSSDSDGKKVIAEATVFLPGFCLEFSLGFFWLSQTCAWDIIILNYYCFITTFTIFFLKFLQFININAGLKIAQFHPKKVQFLPKDGSFFPKDCSIFSPRSY